MDDPLKVLIIEDSEIDALLVLNELERTLGTIESRRVDTEEALTASLNERRWDFVIGDYNLPGFDGLSALAAVRSAAPDLPFIMISGLRGEEFAVEAMRAGAGDFVAKDDLSRLAPAIRREIEASEARRGRRQADEALKSRNRRLRLLSDLAEYLLSAEAPVDAASAAYDTIAEELDLQVYFNFLIEPDDTLRLDSWRGIPDHAAHLIRHPKPGQTVCGVVAQTGEAWHVPDIQHSEDELVRLIRHYGLRAYYCSPLKIKNDLLGTLSFGTRTRDRFDPEELDFMGTVVRYVALANERLRTSRELQRREAQFRAFFENAAVGATEVDLENRILRVNDRFTILSGYGRDELIGRDLHTLTHPDYSEAERRGFRELIDGKSSIFEMEKKYVRKDGNPIWVQETTGVIFNDKGHPERLAGIVLDISERKSWEMEREYLLAELDTTIQSIASGVVIYGFEGELRRLNPAAEKMFRYSPEMMERPIRERKAALRLQGQDGEPYPLERYPPLLALGGETILSEVMVLHPHGSEEALWVAVSAAPIRMPDGSIIGAVSTLTDITPLHELQKERELYAHTISHDLRTPLTVVLGHAEMLGESCPDENSHQHVEAILKGAERMEKMIEDLVEAARLEGGEMTLETETIPLDTFLADLLRHSSTALGAERMVVDVPPSLPPVVADPDRLERIFTNLLTNAMKYSPPESPVEVSAQQRGNDIAVSVRDRGQGIHPQDIPHIFDRFYRPQDGRKAGSVGLGLYITRSLVRAHGGEIQVESEPGRGSVFTFTLPASPGETA